MFCSTNEVFLNLTEKTKLFAQKCAQFRSNGPKNCGDNNIHSLGHLNENNKPLKCMKNISKSINDVHDNDKKLDDLLNSATISQRKKWKLSNDKMNSATACFCALAGSLRLKRRRSFTDRNEHIDYHKNGRRKSSSAFNTVTGNTCWYVKVSIKSNLIFFFVFVFIFVYSFYIFSVFLSLTRFEAKHYFLLFEKKSSNQMEIVDYSNKNYYCNQSTNLKMTLFSAAYVAAMGRRT